MIDEELLNKFDRIQDLSVSEEMLGAYIEGSIGSNDASLIELAMSQDAELSDFVDSITRDSSFILNNIESLLFDSTGSNLLLDLQLPNPENGIICNTFYEGKIAEESSYENLFEELELSSSGDLSASDSYLKNNLYNDDSFCEPAQSLDIDSPEECDGMYNDESMDI